MDVYTLAYRHPLGVITAGFTERGLCEIDLGGQPPETPADPPTRQVNAWATRLIRALDRYFAGNEEDFRDIPLDWDGATPFRRAVWETARGVGWGEPSSYGDLARRMGRTTGCSRAVGQALGANPVPIVVPCHRFLAGDGTIGGFTGGLGWKRAFEGGRERRGVLL